MKNLFLAIVIVLSAGSISAQTKIGHVNTQKILDTMPSRKLALQKLEEIEKSSYDELIAMQKDYEKAVQVYLTKKKNGEIPPVIQEVEERKLMTKEQNIANYQQSAQQDLQTISQDMNQPILETVQKAVKIVAERNKLSYVIDEGVTLYFAGGIDVTAEVIAEVMKLEKIK